MHGTRNRNSNMKSSYRDYSDRLYLQKEDFPQPRNLTVSDVWDAEVGKPGEKPKLRVIIKFKELEKALCSNPTNNGVLGELSGSENPKDWIGLRVRGWNDPDVYYQGKKTGGIRLVPIRASKPVRFKKTNNTKKKDGTKLPDNSGEDNGNNIPL
jgi:hypothetical protein